MLRRRRRHVPDDQRRLVRWTSNRLPAPTQPIIFGATTGSTTRLRDPPRRSGPFSPRSRAPVVRLTPAPLARWPPMTIDRYGRHGIVRLAAASTPKQAAELSMPSCTSHAAQTSHQTDKRSPPMLHRIGPDETRRGRSTDQAQRPAWRAAIRSTLPANGSDEAFGSIEFLARRSEPDRRLPSTEGTSTDLAGRRRRVAGSDRRRGTSRSSTSSDKLRTRCASPGDEGALTALRLAGPRVRGRPAASYAACATPSQPRCNEFRLDRAFGVARRSRPRNDRGAHAAHAVERGTTWRSRAPSRPRGRVARPPRRVAWLIVRIPTWRRTPSRTVSSELRGTCRRSGPDRFDAWNRVSSFGLSR